MADWRQIQARIRKAKAAADAPQQLADLYEKTRDAMVAFELATLHEKAGQNAEAARWYSAAAERFRRAQWKTKAEQALARLGDPTTFGAALGETLIHAPELAEVETPPRTGTQVPPEPAATLDEPAGATRARDTSENQQPGEGRSRRRRGRRGGRRRRRSGEAQPEAATRPSTRAGAARAEEPAEASRPPVRIPAHVPPSEVAALSSAQLRGRAGDPGLASRLVHLESQLRRLIAGPLYRLDDSDQAPAGPGVFVVSDSDQITYYYIEACQTLRIGVANLLRGERGRRTGEPLREKFADHLGISEARVPKYLKDHCTVRWLQLDEGASQLAHFAIAVLRPALND